MSLPPHHHGPVLVRPAAKLFPEPLHNDITFLSDVFFDKQICIRHPAYDDGDDILLILPARDNADGGLHYGFVMTVCHIISNNQEGSLTASRIGAPIQVGVDDVLRAGDYYYHVPPLPTEGSIGTIEHNRWPVVNSFLDWTFPSQMPTTWTRLPTFQPARSAVSQSALSAVVKARDISCRISSHETGVELAHLCPRNEMDWFMRNHMYRWNSIQGMDGDNLTNDPSNLLLLRADLHKSFDQRHFVFFPKCSDSYVIHMLAPTPDIGQLYHNVRLAPIPQCNPHFLYARLAWAILPYLSGFLSTPGSRCIVRVNDKGKTVIEDDSEVWKRRERAAEARRDQSPKKRSRTIISTSQNEDDGNEVEHHTTSQTYVEADAPLHKKQRKDGGHLFDPLSSLSHHDTYLSSPEQLSSDLDPEEYNPLEEPPSWYPGWENAQRLKEQYLRENINVRPDGFVPTTPGRLPSDGSGDVKEQLRAMGFEILDDNF